MAQPRIYVNKNSVAIPVYHPNDSYLPTARRIGQINPNEMFAAMQGGINNEAAVIPIEFYSNTGWRKGNLDIRVGNYTLLKQAYSAAHSFGFDACGNDTVSGYKFRVRSACRIFDGETFVTRLYAGDVVYVTGTSYGGLKYPYRLHIKGYKRYGDPSSCRWVANGWADTDMEIGSASYPCVYGQW